MTAELCNEYVQRLHIDESDTKFVVKKSMEIYPKLKLIQNRLSDTAKMVLCIDCAATSLNIEFSSDEAIKLAALSKLQYVKNKENYENQLGLRQKLTLNGICAQLEMNDAIRKGADQLLKDYKKKHSYVQDVFENPQYLAMAIYQSCKLRKFKKSNVKPALIQLSRLNKKMWKELEDQWTEWMKITSSTKSEEKENVQMVHQDGDQTTHTNNASIENEIQSYEEWRDMMIKKAENALRKER